METRRSLTPGAVEAALAWARQRFRHRRFRRLSLGGLTLLGIAVVFGSVFSSLQTPVLLAGALLGLGMVWFLAFLTAQVLPVSHESAVWLADRAFGLEDRLVTSQDSGLEPGRFRALLVREVEVGLEEGRAGTAPPGVAAGLRFRRTRRFLRRWGPHLLVVILLAVLFSARDYLGGGGGPDVQKPDSRKVLVFSRPNARDRLDRGESLPHFLQQTPERSGGTSGAGAAGSRSSRTPLPGAGAGREEESGPGSRNSGGPRKPKPRNPDPGVNRGSGSGGRPRKDPAVPPALGKPRRTVVKTSPRFVLPLLDKKGRILHKKRWAIRFLQDAEGVSGSGGTARARGSLRHVVAAFQKRAERIMDRRGIPEPDRALYLRYLKALAEELAEE